MLRKSDVEELGKYKFGKISEIESYKKFFEINKNNEKNTQQGEIKNGNNQNNLKNANISTRGKITFVEFSGGDDKNSRRRSLNISNNSNSINSTPLPLFDFSILPSELKIIRFNNFGNGNLYNSIVFLSSHKNWLNGVITRFDLKRKLFVIKLWIQGKPKSVLIDESIPILIYKDENNSPMITPGFLYSEDQFWILLLEKAYAKINRSYGNTIRSLASEIIPVLTEAPLITLIHNHNKKRTLWNLFNEAAKKHWVIFSEFESMSLEYYSPEHFISYFVINIFKVNKTKYIELTIPENESKTFNQIKERLQKIPEEHLNQKQFFPEVKVKSNKIIYMNFDNFYKAFDKTCVLKCESNYHYNFKKFKINSLQYNLVKLKLQSKTKLTLTLHLKQTRYYIKFNNYDIPVSRLMIGKLKFAEKYVKIDKMISKDDSKDLSIFEEDYEISLEYINSSYGKQEKQMIELELEDGVYYIFFKVYTEMQFNVVLSTYSDTFIQFEENLDEVDLRLMKNNPILNDREIQSQFIQENSMLSNVNKKTKNNSNSTSSYISNAMNELFSSYLDLRGVTQIIENDSSMFYSYSLTDTQFGFSVMKFENKSKEKILNLVLNFENNGMTMISHEKGGRKSNKNLGNNKNKLTSSQNIINSHSNRSNISSTPQEITLHIPPMSKELIIFEWDKNFNEISINIRPTFTIDIVRPILEEKDFFNKPKTFITNDIFYYEIAYFKGVFIIIVNESLKDYNIQVDFEKLNNLLIFYPYQFKGLSKIDVTLCNRSKYYINLKMINETNDVSYKINFTLKSAVKDIHNKSTVDKV